MLSRSCSDPPNYLTQRKEKLGNNGHLAVGSLFYFFETLPCKRVTIILENHEKLPAITRIIIDTETEDFSEKSRKRDLCQGIKVI